MNKLTRYLVTTHNELEHLVKEHMHYDDNVKDAIERELSDIVDYGRDEGYLNLETPIEGFFNVMEIPDEKFVIVPLCPECGSYGEPQGYADAIQGYQCMSCGNTYRWEDVAGADT